MIKWIVWTRISENLLIPLHLFEDVQKNQIIYPYIEASEKCISVKDIISRYFPDDISYEVLKFFSYGKIRHINNVLANSICLSHWAPC